MSYIIPFVCGAASMWLVQRMSVSMKLFLARPSLQNGKYILYNSFRNYQNITLVNKEAMESKGYEIAVNNTRGWFCNTITEIDISKNIETPTTLLKEYELLNKAIHEANFHATYIDNGVVKVKHFGADPDDEDEDVEKTD